MPSREANAILESAGFAPRRTLFPLAENPQYFYSAAELPEAVEEVPWPEFVLDDNVQVIAANHAVQAVWGVEFEREKGARSDVKTNLLSVASDHRFADRMTNWEECVSTMVSVIKSHPLRGDTLDQPSPYMSDVLAEFASGDPAFLRRLIEIWNDAPIREARCRWTYPIVWRDSRFGEMRFTALVNTASEPDGLAFNDWIPLDAATWEALEGLKRTRP